MKKPPKSKAWDILYKNYAKKDIDIILKLRKSSPDFVNEVIGNFGLGVLWRRQILNDREKQIVVLASLITQGCIDDELRRHLHTALKRGLSRKEIKEIPLLLSGYIGIPRCLKAMLLIAETL